MVQICDWSEAGITILSCFMTLTKAFCLLFKLLTVKLVILVFQL